MAGAILLFVELVLLLKIILRFVLRVSNVVFFMPPTSKKLRGHIGLGPSVRLSVTPFVDCKTRELFELGT